MADKLCLLVCENIECEVSRIVESERFDDVVVRAFEAHCDRPQMVRDSLRRAIRACEGNCSQIHVLGGACLSSPQVRPDEMEQSALYPTRLHKLDGCYSLFVGNNAAAGYLESGAYLLTPGWLARWQSCVREWGFDQETARKFLAESAARLTLLDTGVDATGAERLAEFASFVDLPFEIVPVGLDFARLVLTRIVLEWRLENEKSKSARDAALTSANRRLADYAMVFDLISHLPDATTEAQAIENILDLFAMLCAPTSLIYIPMVGGRPGGARSRPDSMPGTQATTRLAAFDRDYAWTDSGNGFLLRISHQDETLGVLEVDGLAFPEYKEHYLNLSLTVIQVCGLAIANARSYQKQQSLIEELEQALARRKLAEETLRIKDQAIESSINAIAIGDLGGLITYTNPAFLKLWGYDDQSEILGRRAVEFWQAREQASAVMDALREQGHWIGELAARRKDGSTFDVQLSASLITDQAGRPISLMASFVDVTERKRAEEEIRSLARFPSENPNPILRLSPEGIILYANDASQPVLREWRRQAGEPAPEYWRELVAQALASKTSQIVDVPCGDRVFSFVVVPVVAAGYVNLYGRDITERKQMELALQGSEVKHRTLFETMAQGVVYQAADGSITSANPSAERILGLTLDQMQGRTSLDPRWRAIHEDGSAFPGETHPAMVALRTGQPVENVVMGVFHPARQEYVWINVNAAPQFRPGEARPYQVYATFEDITERKQVEKSLHRQNEYLTALQETTLDLISRFDLDNLLENIVRRAGQLMGTSAGFLDLVEPETNQLKPHVGLGALAESLKFQALPGEGLAGLVWQTGEPVVINDYDGWPGRMENFGRRLIRSVIGVPLLSGSQVLGILGLAYDCTTDRTFGQEAVELLSQFAPLAAIAIENARLVEALRWQTAELQARNQELDTFAHTAAHDLKTPLSLIIGYADLFADQPEVALEEMRQTLRAIVRNGHKMSNIIDELLLLSEVRSADVPLAPIDMAGVLAEVQERFMFDVQERQAELMLPDTSAWPAVRGYAPWIEEVWANYIGNALKYGGAPPRIEIGATRLDDGRVRFWVRDNGRGLAPEDQPRLFQPFARLGQARAKGHGLGLSIVRRIVEKLGGQVGVESQPGQGSTFSFTLPGVPS